MEISARRLPQSGLVLLSGKKLNMLLDVAMKVVCDALNALMDVIVVDAALGEGGVVVALNGKVHVNSLELATFDGTMLGLNESLLAFDEGEYQLVAVTSSIIVPMVERLDLYKLKRAGCLMFLVCQEPFGVDHTQGENAYPARIYREAKAVLHVDESTGEIQVVKDALCVFNYVFRGEPVGIRFPQALGRIS